MFTLGEIINISTVIIGFIALGLIKKTPEHIFNRNIEELKAELQKELQEIRIATENIHPMKIEEYMQFTEVFVNLMEIVKERRPAKQKAMEQKITEGLRRFGFSVILFGSDKTVKKFAETRKYATLPVDERGENENAKTLILMSELIILMREDLGNKGSKVNVDDFLIIIINDWGVSRETFLKKASDARPIP